jgi:tetratricopeptide (TPR) repeat protein
VFSAVYDLIRLSLLSNVYSALGEFSKAKRYIDKALSIYSLSNTLGMYHPNYFFVLNDRGGLFQQIGDFKEAEKDFKQVISIIGANHPYYPTALNNLGLLYQVMGKYGEAESKFQQALDIYSNRSDVEIPEYTITLVGHLSSLLPLFN